MHTLLSVAKLEYQSSLTSSPSKSENFFGLYLSTHIVVDVVVVILTLSLSYRLCSLKLSQMHQQ